ncbi:MAG TPA: 4-alpha-glucanotransferase [Patescibacteria group bacterium]|nr:4-alpha-glucanotransferase [Patescibacteria group bacterium]
MTEQRKDRHLRRLARHCGVATSYCDFRNAHVDIANSVLQNVLRSLPGLDKVEFSKSGVDSYIARKRTERMDRGLPPFLIAWDGILRPLWVWARDNETDFSVTLISEKGEAITAVLPGSGRESIRRNGSLRIKLDWTDKIEFGYYTLILKQPERTMTTFLISAPKKLPEGDRSWGVFAPVHALGPTHDIGNYTDLLRAATFIGKQGGSFVGTLPLSPVYYDRGEISPYMPISRLFLNEIYLDLSDLPGYEHKAEEDRDVDDFVDYKYVYAQKKAIIEDAAISFFEKHPGGDEEFRIFTHEVPDVYAYARFRAESANDNTIDRIKYHLYAQYVCHRQLSKITEKARGGNSAGLYADFPIGVHADGFDDATYPVFLKLCCAGAPPDHFAPRGQNWCFHPFDPRALEREHFRYLRAALRRCFHYVQMLRIDHVMGLYRMYCIPEGSKTDQGTYIYYPFEAMLAVLCLECFISGGVVIGEDLGTVPPKVRKRMEDHGINRMWIFQFSAIEDRELCFSTITRDEIAGFNTHDMFPFEAFLRNDDFNYLLKLNLLTEDEADKLAKERRSALDPWFDRKNDAFLRVLERIARSPARFAIINVEDLWSEEMPQNIPGTSNEYPDWRRKFKYPVSMWGNLERAQASFRILRQARGAGA